METVVIATSRARASRVGPLLARLLFVVGLVLFALPAASQPLPGGNPAAPEQVRFYHQDALGSVRAVSDSGGQILSRSDYLPFGEQIPSEQGRGDLAGYADDAGNKQRFTGKERDGENGLDYFGARYHSAAQGRFTSPDEPLAAQTEADPQSWNLYSYVGNSPLGRVDADGHDWFYKDGETPVWYACDRVDCDQVPESDWNRIGNGQSARTRTGEGTLLWIGQEADGSHWAVHNQRSVFADFVMGILSPGGEERAVATETSLMARSSSWWLRGGEAAGSIGETLESTIKNPRLKRFTGRLYREAATIGDGGTADAIRHTMRTGELVGGSDHTIKGREAITALKRILRQEGLDPQDRAIALKLALDLNLALMGH
jgi:RHS repeat-associated protein